MKMKESQFLLIKEQLKKLTGKECFYKHRRTLKSFRLHGKAT